ncbi:riboflavin biosynthesis protein RibF [candidate division NPL-UPA2 bacterium]|nr:riboflavin biosynthesis protein RibF [candidate division NPL-UPA2 bacterium]
MEVIWGVENIRRSYRGLVLTPGSFDGIHIGHQKVIRMVVERARRIKGTSMVLTFHPHPRRILKPENNLPFLTSTEHKLRLVEGFGVRTCLVVNFNKRFSRISARDFVIEILCRQLKVKEVLAGSNYLFGRGREGDMSFLKQMGKQYGFRVKPLRPLVRKGQVLSSTRIRQLIQEGLLSEAEQLLGRPYSILGRVIRGKKVSRCIGYPTANIKSGGEMVPPEGAYAAWVKWDGNILPAVLGIVNAEEGVIEAHLFDFQKDLYGLQLEIIFIERMRGRKFFSNREEARRQIEGDGRRAREILSRNPLYRDSIP